MKSIKSRIYKRNRRKTKRDRKLELTNLSKMNIISLGARRKDQERKTENNMKKNS